MGVSWLFPYCLRDFRVIRCLRILWGASCRPVRHMQITGRCVRRQMGDELNCGGLAPVRHRDKKFIQVFFEYSCLFTCNSLPLTVFDLGVCDVSASTCNCDCQNVPRSVLGVYLEPRGHIRDVSYVASATQFAHKGLTVRTWLALHNDLRNGKTVHVVFLNDVYANGCSVREDTHARKRYFMKL